MEVNGTIVVHAYYCSIHRGDLENQQKTKCFFSYEVIELKNVNLNVVQNKTEHHTSDYRTSQLILRRGQTFTITLTLSRPLTSKAKLNFVVNTGKPSSGKKVSSKFSLSTKKSNNGSWSAVADSLTSSTVTIKFTSPVNAIVGTYKMIARIFSKGFKSHVIGDFVLLFNPWAPEDDVYLNDEQQRKEYVLNDSTIIYTGNENSIGRRGWNLGQFEDGILQICLTILQKQKAVELSLLNDPRKVSRVCSAMINSNDENGVLTGKWHGSFDDGVTPWSWTGSVKILRQWAESGPVRYGQCWVFAGVLCTVLRCLGIPNRVVTNFTSAHDSNGNLSIDSYFDSNGSSLEDNETYWNFHVWNEAWFTRLDIGSFYNGWQVLDATPQERSEGVFQLGPTSVNAVKQGDVSQKYDGPFVFAEVNADLVDWIYNEEGSYRKARSNTSEIGKFISTKAVGANTRLDITSNYKYNEGTVEERKVYNNALNQLYGRRNTTRAEGIEDLEDLEDLEYIDAMSLEDSEESVPVQTIRGNFKDSDPAVIGQDVKLILALRKTSASKNITISFNVNSTNYNRRTMKSVMKDTMSISMGSEEKEIPFVIPCSKYLDALLDDKMLEVTALCKGDANEELLVVKVIVLINPSFKFKVLNKPVLNKPLKVEVTIVNPLSETLESCVLRAEGSGLIKDQIKHIMSMKPNEEKTETLEFTPYAKGSKQLQVMVTSNKIKNIADYTTIDVEEA
ncbi:protein-glutamine gamma-glutamyltransferase E-like [Leptodactylus fuscus]|uniref:protein-glutamine gamma-glutamyltransferase E-like n=1 Tax=Leptodactylus fuscus TaxID=238119 RepID=UPI003F4F2AFC